MASVFSEKASNLIKIMADQTDYVELPSEHSREEFNAAGWSAFKTQLSLACEKEKIDLSSPDTVSLLICTLEEAERSLREDLSAAVAASGGIATMQTSLYGRLKNVTSAILQALPEMTSQIPAPTLDEADTSKYRLRSHSVTPRT